MDEKEYISLIESNIVLEILKNSSEENPEHKELVEVLKNDKEEFIKMYSIGYNVFIRTLKRIYKLNRIDFKLIDFKLEKTEEESGYIIDRYVVRLEDYKNDHWSMKINLSKYNNCYYIMEPINVNYLSKGW
ncbi:hypothetical protein CJ739_984 [Mariniflexile rhizosphaerae]|uniref:hypothetical protein n=1 Tax=unclassified Mariniflexile TaxID=2643887 RepID=UPI000CC169FA|nr:hypothetical protein [Mariniflexile sp. TRM1-10]AXP80077.1 hypothetical protein CJ739_984 [Mariniflexile sp. TRM1-10]PLB20917.1 MAG: hypothetical protein TRG1_10 [Flavobacteriaceae bacterium FS1-H7996/R]